MISPLKWKTLGHFPLVSVLSLTFSQLHFLVNEKLVDLVPIYRTIKHTHTHFLMASSDTPFTSEAHTLCTHEEF